MVKVETSKCNGCGTCVEICPVEGIKLVGGKAVSNEKCIDCGTCVHCCPTQAITLDDH